MENFFNRLSLRQQLAQLGVCRFMQRSEFIDGCNYLKNKKIVIIGCGAQGLNQGLNMRDSGLNISYALRAEAIDEKRLSWRQATDHGFTIGTFDQLIPSADLIYNLTPDKQHRVVVETIMPLMAHGSALAYSHGFNIVEEGQQIRSDICVVMCAPKCPGTEVREEYKRGFGVPTLIAVHSENDPNDDGFNIAKALASATGGARAGVLASSFVAEVKSDLMGEQTILCGMLQTASIIAYDLMIDDGIDAAYAGKLIQQGLEIVTEALKFGGVTQMMDRLSNPAKLKTQDLSEQISLILRPLFEKHMDDIISGEFSKGMMRDWKNNDRQLLAWRENTAKTPFECYPSSDLTINEQEYFEHNLFLIAMIKSGVEMAFDVMVEAGILDESAYYESLHEVPLIANTIARKRLYEMNVVISDTAEYGNYLFANAAVPLLQEKLVPHLSTQGEGRALKVDSNYVDNQALIAANQKIQHHPVEVIGRKLRGYMTNMKAISE